MNGRIWKEQVKEVWALKKKGFKVILIDLLGFVEEEKVKKTLVIKQITWPTQEQLRTVFVLMHKEVRTSLGRILIGLLSCWHRVQQYKRTRTHTEHAKIRNTILFTMALITFRNSSKLIFMWFLVQHYVPCCDFPADCSTTLHFYSVNVAYDHKNQCYFSIQSHIFITL